MERMRIWSWLGLVLAVIALGASGCCNSPKEYHYPLKPETLEMNQYGLNAEFRMEHTAGHIETFSLLNAGHEEIEIGSCGNCCAQEFKDILYVLFKAETSASQIKLELSQGGTEGVYEPARLGLTINNNGIFYADLVPGSLCAAQQGLQCHDTLTIAGNLYYDVFEFANQGTSQSTEMPKTLYFNADHGLLKYTTLDGAAWQLLQ